MRAGDFRAIGSVQKSCRDPAFSKDIKTQDIRNAVAFQENEKVRASPLTSAGAPMTPWPENPKNF
jgi:hypothetical protein